MSTQAQSVHRAAAADEYVNKSHYLPFELLDQWLNKPIWILLKNNVEYYGTLKGFDDYVNVVLEDVHEVDYGTGRAGDTLQSILLNGSTIAAMCPNNQPK